MCLCCSCAVCFHEWLPWCFFYLRASTSLPVRHGTGTSPLRCCLCFWRGLLSSRWHGEENDSNIPLSRFRPTSQPISLGSVQGHTPTHSLSAAIKVLLLDSGNLDLPCPSHNLLKTLPSHPITWSSPRRREEERWGRGEEGWGWRLMLVNQKRFQSWARSEGISQFFFLSESGDAKGTKSRPLFLNCYKWESKPYFQKQQWGPNLNLVKQQTNKQTNTKAYISF